MTPDRVTSDGVLCRSVEVPWTLLVVSALVVVETLTACGSSTHRTAEPIRSCGIVAVGIGWHASASSDLSCRSARTLTGACVHRQVGDKVLGYACTGSKINDRIRCVRGRTVVIIVANH
jgi:hypothetical protein